MLDRITLIDFGYSKVNVMLNRKHNNSVDT